MIVNEKNAKLARDLVVGDICRSGEVIQRVTRINTTRSNIRISVMLYNPKTTLTRFATWGRYSTIFLAPKPKFENVSCSQCGQEFGPGNHGFSSCTSHK